MGAPQELQSSLAERIEESRARTATTIQELQNNLAIQQQKLQRGLVTSDPLRTSRLEGYASDHPVHRTPLPRDQQFILHEALAPIEPAVEMVTTPEDHLSAWAIMAVGGLTVAASLPIGYLETKRHSLPH